MEKLAIVQESPVLLDRQATLAKAVTLAEHAAFLPIEMSVFYR